MKILGPAMLGAMVGAVCATGAAASPMDGLRWQKRVLLVFEQGDEARSDRQIRELKAGGADERDLLVVRVPRSGVVTGAGAPAMQAGDLRRAYGVAGDAPFTVLLVGKDGGVKERSSEPISRVELFATIDAMPMRVNEMRKD